MLCVDFFRERERVIWDSMRESNGAHFRRGVLEAAGSVALLAESVRIDSHFLPVNQADILPNVISWVVAGAAGFLLPHVIREFRLALSTNSRRIARI